MILLGAVIGIFVKVRLWIWEGISPFEIRSLRQLTVVKVRLWIEEGISLTLILKWSKSTTFSKYVFRLKKVSHKVITNKKKRYGKSFKSI